MKKQKCILALMLVIAVGAQARVINLASPTTTVFQNGDTLTGCLGEDIKLEIMPGAIITLKDATIKPISSLESNTHSGLTCRGDATIVLVGKNHVESFDYHNAAIYFPPERYLYIKGEGSLKAFSHGLGAAIGAGFEKNCGYVVIMGGNITAKTISDNFGSAGIGSSCRGRCEGVTIMGGTVYAEGSPGAAGIGGGGYYYKVNGTGHGKGGHCGTIDIYEGARVSAYGGQNAPGIGCGVDNRCGTITIHHPAYLKARMGDGATTSIGAAVNGKCEQIIHDGTAMSGSVKFISPFIINGNTVDLSEINSEFYTFFNGDTLTGTLKQPCDLELRSGTIVLKDVTIRKYFESGNHPGLNCQGDVTIELVGNNEVFSQSRTAAGIYIAKDKTLTIRGNGGLYATGYTDPEDGRECYGAGIGTSGIADDKAGNIIIEGGTITAKGGRYAAAIGTGQGAQCGTIHIKNTVNSLTAIKGPYAISSIGAGDRYSLIAELIIDDVETTGLAGIGISPYIYTPDHRVCLAPEDVKVFSINPDGATISWVDPEGSDPVSYKVQWRDEMGGWVEERSVTLYHQLYYKLEGLKDYKIYFVRVGAGNQKGEYVWSEEKGFITEQKPCLEPQGFEFVTATYNTASFKWDDEGLEWYVRFRKIGTEEWTEYYITLNEITIAGLEPETAYEAQVGIVCQHGVVSAWTASINFETSKEPWHGNLDELTEDVKYVVARDGVTIEGSNSYNCSIHIADGATVYLRDAAIHGGNEEGGYAGIMCDGDATIYVSNCQDPLAANAVIQDVNSKWPAIYVKSGHTLNITGPGKMLVMGGTEANYTIGNQNGAIGGTVNVNGHVYATGITEQTYMYPEDPVCNAPDHLLAWDITDNSATIIWEPRSLVDEDASWQLILYEGDNIESVIGNIISSPYYLVGLKPSTEYSVYVRTQCSDELKSEWSEELKFTTAATPTPAPEMPTVTYVSDKQVWLDWEPGGEETTWRIMYGKKGSAGSYQKNGITAHPYKLTGLTAETEYWFKICATPDPSDTETWSEYVYFENVTTLSEAEGCNKPKNVSLITLTPDSVVIEWTPGGNEEIWRVWVSENKGTAKHRTTTKIPFTLKTKPNTEYAVFIDAICSEDPFVYSDGSDHLKFTTPAVAEYQAILARINSDLQAIYNFALLLGVSTSDAQMQALYEAIGQFNAIVNNPDATGTQVINAIKEAEAVHATAVETGLSAFKDYKKASFETLLKEGDSKNCELLVTYAREELDELAWSLAYPAAENFTRLNNEADEIEERLIAALEAQREYEQPAEEDDITVAKKELELWMFPISLVYQLYELTGDAEGFNEMEALLVNADAIDSKADATLEEVNDMIATLKEAAEAHKAEVVQYHQLLGEEELDALLEEGDSQECINIIENAKDALRASLAWNDELAYFDNIDALAGIFGAIYDQAVLDLAAQRAKEHPTAIETVESQKSNVESRKVFRNGMLYIEHNGKRFNAQGTEVK